MSTEVTKAPEQTPAETAAEPARARRIWRPLSDIVETREGVTLMLELPGVAAEDVDVSLEKRVLTIRAKSSVASPDRLRLVHAEYEPGDYERAFALSDDFDGEKIEAELKNGVLTVRLPRAEAAQPRTIRVKAA
jgi:HSP20 family molecular chaperone IbpA